MYLDQGISQTVLLSHVFPAVVKAVAGYTNTNRIFFGVVVCATFFGYFFLVLSYALLFFPNCFSERFTLTTRQPGLLAKIFVSFLAPWSI